MAIQKLKSMSRRTKLLFGFVLVLLVVAPTFIWITLSDQPFGGDQSVHAKDSVILYYAFSQSPMEWLYYMLKVIPFRGPGVAWIGQFFVPLGSLLGSIDKALLFSVAIAQIISLWLIYRSVLELSDGSVSIAALTTLFPASLFVFNREYMLEPFQVLAIAWFVLILSFTPKWSRAFVLGQLGIASLFAVLIRATSLVYCVIFILVILFYILFSRTNSQPWGWLKKGTLINWGIGAVLLVAAIAWYNQNLNIVIQHSLGSSGPKALLWGKEDTFLNNFAYWLLVIRQFFIHPIVLELLFLFFVAGLIVCGNNLIKKRKELQHYTFCAVISILQIVVVLVLLSVNVNRSARFLFPLLPCFALVICWGIAQINKRAVTSVAIILLIFQLLTTQGYSIRNTLNTRSTNANILSEIVTRTCSESDSDRYLTIIAIDPHLRGDWLAPMPAEYTAAKKYGINPPCYFGYTGNSFFGAGLKDTWEDLTIRRPRYFVTTDPAIYPPPLICANQSLTIQNHPALLEMIRTSGIFRQEPALLNDPGILVFRYIDYIQEGRTVLDQGHPDRAIAILKKATALEPKNSEAWANLTLAYISAKRGDEALSAAKQALALNPDHYYVNSMVASVYHERGAYTEALQFIQRAIPFAPNDQEKTRILKMQAYSYTALNNFLKACTSLHQAFSINSAPNLLDEIEKLECSKVLEEK